MAVFDKSFLQSLSVDEAVVFDVLFMSNITPLFFVETLADLKKQMSDGRTAEQVVGNLARKTPQLHSYPNTHHLTLCASELLGESVEMAGRPAVAHGKPFRVGKRNGVSFGIAPEMEALQRWQSHQFLDVERDFAAQWRAMLKELPAGALKLVQQDGEKLKLADLAAAKAMAADLVDKAPQLTVLRMSLEMAGLGAVRQKRALDRWHQVGRPPLRAFAPYCTYVMEVEFAFELAAAAGKVPAERPTNRIDLVYLYYLPFCEVFISGDKLHRTLVPAFSRANQAFVWAHDLKSDLARLASYFAENPALEAEGLIRVSKRLPLDGEYLVTGLLDRFRPGWRERQVAVPPPRDARNDRKLVREFQALKAAAARQGPKPTRPQLISEPDTVIFHREVSVRRGKWRVLPAGVEDAADT